MRRLLLQLFCSIVVAALEYPLQAFVPTLVCLLASDCITPPSKLPPAASRACLGQGMLATSNASRGTILHVQHCNGGPTTHALTHAIACPACLPKWALFHTCSEDVAITATGRICCMHGESYMPTYCLSWLLLCLAPEAPSRIHW